MRVQLYLFFWTVVFSCAADSADVRRPFWIIAHMINDQKHIDQVLAQGANALEVDVDYDSSGTPLDFYHGFPCDLLRWCWDRNEIPSYLDSVRERTTPGSSLYNPALTLVEFDNKLGDVEEENLEAAGKLFADHVTRLYSAPSRVKVVISVPRLSQKKFILGFRNQLLEKHPDLIKNFGFEFSEERETSLLTVRAAFESVGVRDPYIWLSNGRFNGHIFDIDFHHLFPYRDEPGLRFASKVYGWTADTKSKLQRWVERGVDAIITNDPEDLRDVLRGFWKTHRLATQDDNPFQWIPTHLASQPPFYSWYGCSFNWWRGGSYCWKTCHSIGYCWMDTGCGEGDEVCYQDEPCRSQDDEQQCHQTLVF